MIAEVRKVICESIPPFSTARINCSLDECDYVEEEYYIYGTSRLYTRDREANKAKILMGQAPYVNRFILRAPRDPRKASGNVVVELLNPSSGMEIERMWINTFRKFMRDGDIYVGLTIKPNTLKCLKVYSEERYGCLEWPNPRAELAFPFSREEAAAYVFGMHISHDFETGLCWDMITDLAHLLRSDQADNPLRDYGNLTLVLTGWSQDVSYIRTYVNYFANEMEENIYDGYLCAGGVPALFMALNQYELLDVVDSKLGRVHHCRAPFMAVQPGIPMQGRCGGVGESGSGDGLKTETAIRKLFIHSSHLITAGVESMRLMGEIVVLMLAGWFLRWRGVVTDSGRACLTDLIMYVILPCNILHAFLNVGTGTAGIGAFMGMVLLISILIQILCTVIGHLCYLMMQPGSICSLSGSSTTRR